MIFRKNILIFANIITNIVILFTSCYLNLLPLNEWYLTFAVISLIQLSVNLYTLIKLENNFFSLTVLFLIFSYITHLGILVLYGFDIDIYLPWDPLTAITSASFKTASYYTIFSNSFLAFGMYFILYCRNNSPDNSQVVNINEEKELFLSRTIGKILILIGIFPMLYIDIKRMILYKTGGYLATYNFGTNGFVSVIARMTEIGIMMLLIGSRRNKRKAISIIVVVLLYQCIIIFTGNRGRPIMFSITILFIYFNFIKSIKFKDIFKIGLFAYFAGFLLTYIGQIRSISAKNINLYIGLAKSSFIEFSPFKILAEFGMTIITLARSIQLVDSTNNIQFGSTYILSAFTMFPNIHGALFQIINKAVFVNSWPIDLRRFLGGSYLGEIYWNFGKYSFILVFFIGVLIAFISNRISKLFSEKKYVYMSIFLILFPNLLWWVRDYFTSMVREFTWISIFILILYDILIKKINNEDIQ
jgi:hypothetical protein